MKCYFFMGLPGSGKSFLTEKIMKDNPDIVLLSMDNIIESYAKKHNLTYRQVWADHIKIAEKEFENTLSNAIENKKEIIWDQTNLHQLSRAPKIKRLLDNHYQIEGIALELSSTEWKARIEKREKNGGKVMLPEVLTSMEKSYQSPEYSEGFQSIYIVNDKNEIALKFNQTNVQLNIKASRETMTSNVNSLHIKHSK